MTTDDMIIIRIATSDAIYRELEQTVKALMYVSHEETNIYLERLELLLRCLTILRGLGKS